MTQPEDKAAGFTAGELENWRDEIGHPNSRLLFKRMMHAAGIVLGEDNIVSALDKVEALSARAKASPALYEALKELVDVAHGSWFADDGTDSPAEREALRKARAALSAACPSHREEG